MFVRKKGRTCSIAITSLIMDVLLAQAINLNPMQSIYVYHLLEVITWLIGVFLLRRETKEYVIAIGMSIIIAMLYQQVMPYWG